MAHVDEQCMQGIHHWHRRQEALDPDGTYVAQCCRCMESRRVTEQDAIAAAGRCTESGPAAGVAVETGAAPISTGVVLSRPGQAAQA